MTARIRPQGARVVVRLDDPIQTTEAGLVLGYGHVGVDAGGVDVDWGTVEAVGTGRAITRGPSKGQRIPVELEVGDRVCFEHGCGLQVIGDRRLLIVWEDHIMARVRQGGQHGI